MQSIDSVDPNEFPPPKKILAIPSSGQRVLVMMNFDLSQYLNPVFVETGFENGNSVKAALDAGFSKIISIEIDPSSVDRGRRRFSTEIASGRLTLIHGDAGVEFHKVIENIAETCTFWLDAHNFTVPETGEVTCSLMCELNSLLSHPIREHTILIDDRRLFGTDTWGRAIAEDEVLATLRRINPEYRIEYLNGFVPNDVIAAIPGS